jgi:hypothetical protein
MSCAHTQLDVTKLYWDNIIKVVDRWSVIQLKHCSLYVVDRTVMKLPISLYTVDGTAMKLHVRMQLTGL